MSMPPRKARRPRVLLLAEAANPEWVSVPLVGWSLAQALRSVADVHLVTQIRNRDAILRAGLLETVDFTAIDSEAFAAPAWRLAQALGMREGKGWTVGQAVDRFAYPHFERLVWRRFASALRAGAYDLVHRVTPLSPTRASPIASRLRAIGVPFVLGPLNGGVPWPAGFDAVRRQEREWLSYLRGAYRLLPGHGRTYAAAAAVLAGSRHTEREIPASVRARCIYMPENAIDPARFDRIAAPPKDGPLRACFVGRLVPYKGPDMALEAAAPLLADGRMRLDFVGDGPMADALRRQAAALGVAGAVVFHGRLPHERVQDVAAGCHVLTFPSIREFGGGVVLEAMALGVVPVVVNYAGPGELVTARTGIALPLGPRDRIVADLRATLERLAGDRTALGPMAEAGRETAMGLFTWQAKAEQIAQVYDWILADRPDAPPRFGFPG